MILNFLLFTEFGLWLQALLITAGITLAVIDWYRAHGWDRPHTGHRQRVKDTHQGQVPRGGGVAVFGGILTTVVLLLGALVVCALPVAFTGGQDSPFFPKWFVELEYGGNPFASYGAIMLAAALLAFVGWLDDIRDLSPGWRLVVNIIAAVIIVRAGMSISFVTHPFDTGVIDLTFWPWLPGVLTIVYLVALTNITNWAKGIDGQMPGTVAIAAAWVGLLALRPGAESIQAAILGFIVSGAFTGFLVWNFYPQKIMPGYGGGSLAGFLLGVLSIMAGAKIATLFMVLALPIADAVFTILRRLIAGQSIFLGDRGHLHHKLLDTLHWGRRRIAIFYWLVTLLMGFLALVLPTWGKIVAFLAVCAGVFVFLIHVKLTSRKVGVESGKNKL